MQATCFLLSVLQRSHGVGVSNAGCVSLLCLPQSFRAGCQGPESALSCPKELHGRQSLAQGSDKGSQQGEGDAGVTTHSRPRVVWEGFPFPKANNGKRGEHIKVCSFWGILPVLSIFCPLLLLMLFVHLFLLTSTKI